MYTTGYYVKTIYGEYTDDQLNGHYHYVFIKYSIRLMLDQNLMHFNL